MKPCPMWGSYRCSVCFPPQTPTPVGKYEKRLLGTKPDVIVHDEIVDMGPVITPTKGENVSAVTSSIDNLKGQVQRMESDISALRDQRDRQAETIKDLQRSDVRMLLIRRDGTTRNAPCYIGEGGGPQRSYQESTTGFHPLRDLWELGPVTPVEKHTYRLLDVVGKLAVYGEV